MGPRAASTSPTSAKSSHWRHPCRSLTCKSANRLRSEGVRRRLRPLTSLGLQTGKSSSVQRRVTCRPESVPSPWRMARSMSSFAIEQLQPELGFECFHLVADGALGDAEFLGGAREALVAGRGFESLERIERRQAARHGSTEIMRKTEAG